MKRLLALIVSGGMLLSAIPFASAEAELSPALQTIAAINFDDASNQGVYPTGNCSSELSDTIAYSAPYSLHIYNRDQTWNASEFDMGGKMKEGDTYRLSAYVYHECEDETMFQFSLKVNEGELYTYCAQTVIPAGEWTYLGGEYTVEEGQTSIKPYIELISSLDSFYVDDIRIDLIDGEVISTEIDESAVSLKDAFDDLTIGASIGSSVISADPSGNQLKLLTKHFDTISIENQLKAQFVLDYAETSSDVAKYNESAALSFAAAKPYMDFAKENGLKVNAQALVWFSMTPEWFFHEGYDVNKPLASRELMLKRLENYIEGVLTWCETNYPGLITSWVVVNEAVDGDANPKLREDELWYATIGEDYVAKAFEYANLYRPDNCVYLYNDYNMEAYTEKTQFILDYLNDYGIIENGYVDGIGFQAHIKMSWPGTGSMEDSMRMVHEAGLKVLVTELDIAFGQSEVNGYASEYFAFRAQQERYYEIFASLLSLKEEGIDIPDITLWGLTDAYTWLTGQYGETQYPLLFDEYNQVKPAYYGVLQAAGVLELENLALGKEAVTSGIQADNHPANYAFDGNLSTRWASQRDEGPYWIYVDLGESKTFNFVKLYWESSYATNYRLQYCVEAPESEENWVDFTGKLSGGGQRSIFTDGPITARYIRMYAIEKNNDWGCSLYEMCVYNDETIPDNPYNKDPNASENYAFEKEATASSHENNHTAALAVDGDMSSRWGSLYTDPQSITVDLGEEILINRVVLRWETAFGKDYTIEVSTDNENWETVYTSVGGKGGVETIDFDDTTARYVKMNGTARGSSFGYSLYEFEVYYMLRPEPEITPEDFGITLDGDYALGFAEGDVAADYEGLEFDTDTLATGSVLTYNGKDYIVIIKGDVSGDGIVNSTDFVQIRKKFLGLYEMNDTQLLAADADSDGNINSTDFMRIRRHFLGVFDLYS